MMATKTKSPPAPAGARRPAIASTRGYAAQGPTTPLAPFTFERRATGPRDVRLDILYCGVCHSDLHLSRNEWGGSTYPIVPGHEIVGRVTEVGSEVRGFAPGDLAAVGCMVDSCRTCPDCQAGLEQYCQTGVTLTYNSPDKYLGGMTYGGYSDKIVVDQDFVLRVSDRLDPAAAAPLLCAGITTYSPLRHWGVGQGSRVGVVGLGGLGHMGVKLAHAFGAEVTLFTTSPGKADDARRLGADEVVVSRDPEQMAKQANRFDFILDTVAVAHDLGAYLEMLKRDGTLCLVGMPDQPHPPFHPAPLILRRRQLAGSVIGGIRETQEMLDFCAAHDIVSDIERIPIQAINEAYERMLKSDVRYRFVIDMASLRDGA
jgi:alcohol dehydrogenase (NADP+)